MKSWLRVLLHATFLTKSFMWEQVFKYHNICVSFSHELRDKPLIPTSKYSGSSAVGSERYAYTMENRITNALIFQFSSPFKDVNRVSRQVVKGFDWNLNNIEGILL